jgi:cob(I)alamin adenosyltransferase
MEGPLMKIYTKTGDAGETGLFGGGRAPKDDLRIEAYGTVDELNAFLGLAVRHCTSADLKSRLERVQGELFQVGADLATPLDAKTDYITRLDEAPIQRLESEIDEWEAVLPALTSFILPGGSQPGAVLHIARTVCRRAERRAVALARAETINPHIIRYLNRLSDWLFVLARMVNFRQNTPETPWP